MKPTGEILPLAKTPFDLRMSKHLGRAIFKLPKEDKGKTLNCFTVAISKTISLIFNEVRTISEIYLHILLFFRIKQETHWI